MTHAEIILERISQGPAAMCDLACELHTRASVLPCDMYTMAYRATKELIDCGKVEKHVSGCYMLAGKTPIEQADLIYSKLVKKDKLPKLPSGTHWGKLDLAVVEK